MFFFGGGIKEVLLGGEREREQVTDLADKCPPKDRTKKQIQTNFIAKS